MYILYYEQQINQEKGDCKNINGVGLRVVKNTEILTFQYAVTNKGVMKIIPNVQNMKQA
jgi:hypothetical protein